MQHNINTKNIFVSNIYIISILFFIVYITGFSSTYSLYNRFKLEGKISYSVFKNAINGSSKIKDKNSRYLTIIDFTKPSTEPRFLVLDFKNLKLLYYTYATHGKNSGKIIPTVFSNAPNSYQSSLGFYLTDKKPYTGRYGYSLRLIGLENRFNSNAYSRAIVIHGAEYASKKYIDELGFLGRTYGCPAIPVELSKEVIDLISNKTVIYIAGNDEKYLKMSRYIN